jgi:hypothetical protein
VTRGVFAGFLAVTAALRLHAIVTVAYDPDEFEHLHAGLMFSQGSVPYRDFFEHHGPLTYLIAWLPAKLLGPTTDLLTINRCLSLFFSIVTCCAVFRLSESAVGRRSAPWSLVWLLTLPWFADKSLEWRPDVPAMTFITLAAWAAGRNRSLTAGLCVAAAALCTQKAVAMGLGVGIALLVNSPAPRRDVIRFLLGCCVPWLAAVVGFTAAGGLGAFLKCMVYIPAVWPMRVSVGRELFMILVQFGAASLAVGAAAWFMAWKPLPNSSPRKPAWDAVRIPILLHWLSWPFVPAAYMQFHLLGLPLLAVAAAKMLRRPILKSKFFPVAVLVLLVPNACWFWQQQVVLPKSNPVTRTTQLAAIQRLAEAVPYSARVQDGFTGLGCLHARADYWWWINEHSLKLLERLDELKSFRGRMKRNPPDALLLDAGLHQALEPLKLEIERDYDVVERNEPTRYLLLKKK